MEFRITDIDVQTCVIISCSSDRSFHAQEISYSYRHFKSSSTGDENATNPAEDFRLILFDKLQQPNFLLL